MESVVSDPTVEHDSNAHEVYPSIGADATAWLQFKDKSEHLRVSVNGNTVDVRRDARFVVPPAIVSRADGTYVAWAEGDSEQEWNLLIAPVEDPSDPALVASFEDERVASLSGASNDEGSYIAVELSGPNGVSVRVYRTDADGGDWESIHETGSSTYQPSLTVSGERAGIVYSTYAGDHYEIHYEELTGDRHELVSKDGIYNHSPDVTIDGSGRVWVAWVRESERVNPNREQYIRDHVRVQTPERFALQTPWYRHMRCYVRRLDKEAYTRLGAQEQRNAHHPRLAVGPSGRPWVFTRYLASPNRDLDVPKYGILAHGGPQADESGGHHGWNAPRLVTHDLAGRNSKIGIHETDSGFELTWSVDSRSAVGSDDAGGYDNDTQFVRTNDELRTGTSTVVDEAITEADLTDASSLDIESAYTVLPSHESHTPFNSTSDRNYTIEDHGEDRDLVFGNVHRHSTLSMCGSDFDMDQQFHYRYAMDVSGEGFTAVTDHGEDITAYDWHELTKYAEIFDAPDDFTVFPGYEFTGSRQIYADYRGDDRGFGHAHVITRTPDEGYNHIYQEETPTVQSLLETVDPENELPIPHHPADAQFPFDFDEFDTDVAPIVELFQDYRGASEYPDDPRHVELPQVDDPSHYVQSLLDAGNRVGLTSSGDHYSIAFAGVYTTDHSRDGIFQALRDRRCYATTGAKIVLEFRANEELMGSELHDVDGLTFDIEVQGTDTIDAIELIHGGETIHAWQPDDEEASVTYEQSSSEPGYYYVRIHQEDEQMAWSSPIWVE